MKTRTYELHLVKSEKKNNTDILSVWCSCMAGAYKICNHFVVTLCKTEYANNKRWCSPSCSLSCTDTACQWNKSTKKGIEPKRVTELFAGESLRTK